MDQSGWSNWIVIGPDSENSGVTLCPADPSSQNISILHDAMAIQFDVIKKATRNFRPDLLLGEGRHGLLYKGVIDEHPLTAVKLEPGIVVAVRKLDSNQVARLREFLEEVNYLSKLRHPNLVKLIGYCFEADNRILVYEFMRCGSLDYHLFTRRDHALLWERRLKVAVGAARALACFRELGKPYIHGNFSSGDILLDGEFNAKLSDYGLRRVISFAGAGSRKFGYDAPEYVATGYLYKKSDVYSFGVVLLELLSGLRAYDRNRAANEEKLVDWVKPYLGSERELSQIMDPRLEGRFLLKDAYKVAKLASLCVSLEPRSRPSMAEVVDALDLLLLEINGVEQNRTAVRKPKRIVKFGSVQFYD